MMRGREASERSDVKGRATGMWDTGYWIEGMHGKEKSTKRRIETTARKHCLVFVSHHGVIRAQKVNVGARRGAL